MKIIKKLLIIIPVTVFTIFLILLAAPILFKGKILEIAKKELNGMLTAQVDFSDLKLSFIRNFPDAYLALEDLTVTCTGAFANETLVEFKSLSMRVDIMSVIRMSDIRIKSILLDRARVSAHILENGEANWNILKPKETASPPPSDKTAHKKNTSASVFKIALTKFEIRDADISFRDDSRRMTAAANGLNYFLHGDMTLDNVDLNMKLDIAGLNFRSLSDIVPLDDITLKGLLECDLALSGRMSTLEKQEYENFDAKGSLKLSGVDFNGPGFQQAVKITDIRLNLTPKRVELTNFDALIGSSDLSLNGMLENFIPFVFKSGKIRGSLNLKSNNIDLNEFMKRKRTAEKPEETPSPSVIEVPKNVDFTVNVGIAKLLFGKLRVTDMAGTVLVQDGRLLMRNLAMNTMGGSVALSGGYNTQDIKAPSVNLDADIRLVDVTSALSSFDIFEKILPNPQNYTGKVSANMSMGGVLGDNLSPVLNTLASKGRLQTHNLKIQNSELFSAMANLLKNESWRDPTLDDINVKYEIRDGRLIIDPVRINVAQTALEISGGQGLDMTLNYKVNAAVPVSSVGSAATDVLGKIPGGSNIREIKVTGLMGGSVTKPVVTLDVADMANNVVETVKETVKDAVKENVEKQAASIMDAFKKNR
jgi:hypothetical protein